MAEDRQPPAKAEAKGLVPRGQRSWIHPSERRSSGLGEGEGRRRPGPLGGLEA